MKLLARALAGVCDALIAPGYSAPGYWLRKRSWSEDGLDLDLSGRTYLITGANSGLGYAATDQLATRGARVIMVCRDLERGTSARDAIARARLNDRIELRLLDVAELGASRAFCRALSQELPSLDGLILNAGVLLDRRVETSENNERGLATNVLGPHLMLHELAPLLSKNKGRAVFVSSGGMYTQKLNVEDLQYTRRPYDGVLAYAQTKRAEVILTELWAEALRDQGVAVNAMHPGWADTPGVRRSLPRFYRLTRGLLRGPEAGADTAVWLAIAPQVQGATGGFYFDRIKRPTHSRLLKTRSPEADRRKLWQECHRLCRIPEDEPPGQPAASQGDKEAVI